MFFHMINKTINFSYTSREPTREWVYEDGEQGEIYLPELEPEEADSDSVSFSNQHKSIMRTLYQLFPQKFKLIGQEFIPEAQKLFGYNSSTPRFIINPFITRGSFLDPPCGQGKQPTQVHGRLIHVFLEGSSPIKLVSC